MYLCRLIIHSGFLSSTSIYHAGPAFMIERQDIQDGESMTNIRKYIATLILVAGAFLSADAQRIGIKTNLLYDATTTPNLGVEVALGRKHTVQALYGLNPWEFSNNKKLKHWLLMPEYRYWFCEKFNGHFIGGHLMGGQFNVGGLDFPGDMLSHLKDNRYEGWYAGIGFTYGYQWMLSKHWNLEGSIGVGYDYISYKEFPCTECGIMRKKDHENYFGPTKLALSLMYVF